MHTPTQAQMLARSRDDATIDLLLATWRDHRDAQTRAFAIMSVAELGGPVARAALLKELVRCNRPLELSWLALALGVHAAHGRDTAVDSTIGQELRAALYGMEGAPRVHGYLAGVGGVNVAPEQIVGFARQALAEAPQPQSCWVR